MLANYDASHKYKAMNHLEIIMMHTGIFHVLAKARKHG